eukprot:TRINITY_DN1226_c0_g1_i1.p1 TRINITY_DN1226_c0_g1~~TRINITY_DN1226_c0_g1_i1.p1  ORF type:complete len:577 (+),score=170.30 TRINITY_DN1226_c0_g1_i1:32-1762(+)
MLYIIGGIFIVAVLYFLKLKSSQTTTNVVQVSEVIEDVVAKVDDLENGEMQECKVGAGKVLLIKDNDEFFAVGSKCSHAGVSLKNGAYVNGRLRCQRHGACFNVKTGDIEDYPGCDSIPTFDVRVEDGNVLVRGERSIIESRTPYVTREMNDNVTSEEIVVIVGGGVAGVTCAEVLRQEGFSGRITVLNRDDELAYDRPKLSKAMTSSLDKIILRDEKFYRDHNIDMQLGVAANEIRTDEKLIVCSNGEVLSYDHCVLATGADAQRLSFIPGSDAKNIYPLRTIGDAQDIISNIEGKNVVVVGSSFIGMETAASIVKKAASVKVIGMENVPFERVLGRKIGEITKDLHEANGVEFILNAIVGSFEKEGDICNKIILKDGTELDVDVIILGAGVVPTIDYLLDNCTIERSPRTGIIVDEYLQTNAPDVYAIGDIANFPFPLMNGERVRIEHWGMAGIQGKIVAKNIVAGVPTHKCTNIPFFWTNIFGQNITYTGHALKYDDVIFEGPEDQTKPTFIAFYVYEGRTLAVCAANSDPACALAAEILNAGVDITEEEIRAAIGQPGGTLELLKTIIATRL